MSLRPDAHQVRALQASIWSTTAVAFVFLVLRSWARMYKRAIGIDDGVMLLSWVRSSKGFSIGSFNKQTTGQRSNIVTAPHDSKGIPDANSELARLTGYPEQPVVFVRGGRDSTGHPQESYVFSYYGEGFQEERWSSNQTPGCIRVQHQVYQKIASQHNMHVTHGY